MLEVLKALVHLSSTEKVLDIACGAMGEHFLYYNII
jgi:hypothetical protein